MYKPLPDSVTIRESDIEGLGLFAVTDIEKDTFLGLIHIPDGWNKGEYLRTPLGGFGNHSDIPNCDKFKIEESFKGGSWGIRTNKHIYKDEEITWKYTFYEVDA